MASKVHRRARLITDLRQKLQAAGPLPDIQAEAQSLDAQVDTEHLRCCNARLRMSLHNVRKMHSARLHCTCRC